MIPSRIHAMLKTLKCPHSQDTRHTHYFPNLCESCARLARIHLESMLQDWIYCSNDDNHGRCALSPGQHNVIMANNPTELLQQQHNEYYGEFFVQIKNDRVYVIAKFSNKQDNFINDVKITTSRNNNREIHFRHSNNLDSTTPRMDNADLIRRNYQNASSTLIIGEIYFKFELSEVNVHLDIVNDSHIRIIPKKNKNDDRFTFVYRF